MQVTGTTLLTVGVHIWQLCLRHLLALRFSFIRAAQVLDVTEGPKLFRNFVHVVLVVDLRVLIGGCSMTTAGTGGLRRTLQGQVSKTFKKRVQYCLKDLNLLRFQHSAFSLSSKFCMQLQPRKELLGPGASRSR